MKPRYRRMLRGMKVKEEQTEYSASGGAAWFLYILRCGDGSLYTGVTTDLERRLKMHQEGKASRYTRTHLPVELVYSEECGLRSQALVRECAVKSLPRERKEGLIAIEADIDLVTASGRIERELPPDEPTRTQRLDASIEKLREAKLLLQGVTQKP